MEPFVIEISDIVIGVQPMFASTREYCKRYLSERTPDHHVVVTRDDLAFEQRQLEKEAVEQHIRPRKFPEPFLERATILRKTAELLLRSRTLLLHGSTVGVGGAAYLFTAPCGTGKSTHTRLWRQVFGEKVVMINDDKAFLSFSDGTVYACGSPWSGKHGLDTNIQLPLKGICVIGRGADNRIARIGGEDVLPLLREQLLGYTVPEDIAMANALLEQLVNCVPVWDLVCNMEPEAAMVSYRAMSF